MVAAAQYSTFAPARIKATGQCKFSDKCLSGLIVNQFGSDQGSRRRQPSSDIQGPLYVGTNPLRPIESPCISHANTCPFPPGVDFRIPLRLVFKIRIKCEELPEIAVPPFGAQAVEEQAFGTASGQAIEPPRTASLGGISGAEVCAKTTAASRRGTKRFGMLTLEHSTRSRLPAIKLNFTMWAD